MTASRAVSVLRRYFSYAIDRYRRLNIYGKILIWSWLLFYVVIVAFAILVTPSRIAQFLYDQASKVSHARFGWLALGVTLVVISFPPLIGHTTVTILCGFAYGMKGFFITATASLLGSVFVFLILRALFGVRLRKWSSGNSKWQALEAVVRAKGLPLIILIRVSPFPPWVYSNTLFASIESVAVWQFAIATLFTFPKLLLHVFVGSRMAALSDGDTRGRMDTGTKILNGSLTAGGIVLGIAASWVVYTLVQRHIRTLEGLPPDVDRLAAEAIEDFDENAPLLPPLSPRQSFEA